jgi:hypothetical protein
VPASAIRATCLGSASCTLTLPVADQEMLLVILSQEKVASLNLFQLPDLSLVVKHYLPEKMPGSTWQDSVRVSASGDIVFHSETLQYVVAKLGTG